LGPRPLNWFFPWARPLFRTGKVCPAKLKRGFGAISRWPFPRIRRDLKLRGMGPGEGSPSPAPLLGWFFFPFRSGPPRSPRIQKSSGPPPPFPPQTGRPPENLGPDSKAPAQPEKTTTFFFPRIPDDSQGKNPLPGPRRFLPQPPRPEQPPTHVRGGEESHGFSPPRPPPPLGRRKSPLPDQGGFPLKKPPVEFGPRAPPGDFRKPPLVRFFFQSRIKGRPPGFGAEPPMAPPPPPPGGQTPRGPGPGPACPPPERRD